jgi:hypothetical protein
VNILTDVPEAVGLTAKMLDACSGCKRIRRHWRKLPAWLLCTFHDGFIAGYRAAQAELVKEEKL